jgi:hypothetical protein
MKTNRNVFSTEFRTMYLRIKNKEPFYRKMSLISTIMESYQKLAKKQTITKWSVFKTW